jgi:hypothetical protein
MIHHHFSVGKHYGIKSTTDVGWYCVHTTDCANKMLIELGNIEKIWRQA